MVAGFPFFATLLRSIERALAVADLAIFQRYVDGLAGGGRRHQPLRRRDPARVRSVGQRDPRGLRA